MSSYSNAVSSILPLGALAEVRAGYSFRSRLEHDPNGTTAVIQMKDIDELDLLRTDTAVRCTLPDPGRYQLRGGDLLFRSRGRTNTCALVAHNLGPAVLAAPLALIRPRDVLPAYLCWYLNATESQARLASFAMGTSVQMIPLEALRAFEIPVPPREIQQRIAGLAGLALRERQLHQRLATLRHQQISHKLFELANENTKP